MSRIIKFRVWQEARTHVWGAQTVTYPARWLDAESTLVNGRGTLYDNDGYENCSLMDQSEFLTVEQFTGLKDRNGKEIYEGDIVKIEGEMMGHLFSPSESKTVLESARYSWTAKVIWDPGYAQFLFDYIGRHDYQGRGHFCGTAPWCEVVGNVHEHPSLLTP